MKDSGDEMLKPEEIRTLIDNDKASKKKQLAREGDRYFNGQHDIKKYRIFFVDANGVLQEDKIRSNIRISHPFWKIISEQEAQYILSGKEPLFNSDRPELQSHLDERFNKNDDFNSELYYAVLGAIVKGNDFFYAYKDKEGKTCFQCADSLGVVEVRENETDESCQHVIYYYVDRIGNDNEPITKIEVWDEHEVAFYIQSGYGNITLDKQRKPNPRPHILYHKDNDSAIYYEDFGQIPFIRLDNNKKQQSGLLAIKDLIDSYDLMNCGLANSIQDTNESLYVVKGFEGDNLDELMMNIKSKKHIGVGEDGDVEIKTIDIPVEARKTKMAEDKENIFYFGMAVDTTGLKDTSATVSVAVKSAYANLDLKCEGFNKGFKRFLRKILDLVLKEINETEGTDYQQKDVWFNLERDTITNEQENAQIKLTEAQEQQTRVTTILNTATQFGNKLTMQMLCDVMDLDYEEIKGKLPEPEDDSADPFKAKTALDAVVVEEPDGGGVIE
jgi:SPP1 family phage portal protein